MVSTISEEVSNEASAAIEDHSAKVVKIKEANAVKSEKLIGKSTLRNLWKTWVTVIRYMKLKRLATRRHSGEAKLLNTRAALLKWKSRKDATKVARMRVSRLKKLIQTL